MNSKTVPPDLEYILLGKKGLQQAPPPPDGVCTLPELFAYTARQHPQRPALSCPSDGALCTLSYSELAGRAHHISDMLRQKLAVTSTNNASESEPPVVGVWLERSADLTVSVLATTTAGLTWLPFDPDAPVSRVKACLEDSKATLLLCDDAHYDRSCSVMQSIPACTAVRFNDLAEHSGPRRQIVSSEAQRHANAHDPAYLIYTSGSKLLDPRGHL